MSDHVLANLEPKRVFDYFYAITQVPRPSKKEEKIRAYIKATVEKMGLTFQEDQAGNIVVRKPASDGCEKKPTVVLQGHLDMVCQKRPEVTIDFDNDPISPRIDGDYIKATGTTLGADNGIAVATMLALLEDSAFKHGPLEMLFTIDEETGLTGATKLDASLLSGRILINLDSEEEGVLFIGCAGGKDAIITFPAKWKPAGDEWVRLQVSIGGGVGGHSGMDIHLGRLNANKALARALFDIQKKVAIRMVDIKGGSVRNAIPRDAEAHIAVKSDDAADVKKIVGSLEKTLKVKYQATDPDFYIKCKEIAGSEFNVMKKSRTRELINLLKSLPNGVIGMSRDMNGIVETSVNLATIETTKNAIIIGSSQRSSIESEKRDLVDQVLAICQLTKASVRETDGYPGWRPNPHSKLLTTTKKVFKEIYGKTPEVTAVHAGLECGIIGQKFNDEMDMISFGPTLRNVHSPDEALHIPSVRPFYDSVVKLLEALA